MKKLTLEQANSILDVINGADVYSRHLAETLRKLDGKYVKITPQIMKTKATDQKPYFGCIATDLGIKLALKSRLSHGIVVRHPNEKFIGKDFN